MQRKAKDTFSSSRVYKKNDIDIRVILKEGSPLYYEVEEDGTKIKGEGEILLEKALKQPLTRDTIFDQFSRLGNTPFKIRNLEIESSGDLIVPLRELNNIRKDFVAKLEDQRLKKFKKIELPDFVSYMKRKPVIEDAGKKIPKRLSVSVSSLDGLKAALDGGADIIYLYLETLRNFPKLEYSEIEKAFELCKNKVELIFVIPGIIKETRLPYYQGLLKKISSVGDQGFSAANLSGIMLADENLVSGEYTLNVFNSYSLAFLAEEGFKRVVVSPELSLNQINLLKDSGIEKEVIIQGNFPLITTNYCLVSSQGLCSKENKDIKYSCKNGYYLKDRKNYHFPLAFDYECKMYLFNSREMSIYKDLDRVLRDKIDVFRIEARNDYADNIFKKTKLYKDQISFFNKTGKTLKKKEKIEEVAKLTPNGLTSGHLFRGVE